MTVSEWADNNMILDGNSSMPGQYRSSFTPYAVQPMNSFIDPYIEHIILLFGTQGAKTQIIMNMIGYVIDQDPGPTMLVYPEEGTAEFTSLERLQPMFENVDNIRNKFRKRESERLELRFTDMFLAMVGANSASKLASRPIRYLFRDEIAKYKKWTGDEASPLKLSEERTKTFPHNKKIVDASTPKHKGDNIDKAFKSASVRYYYYVSCPHCGQQQQFVLGSRGMPGGIKWPENIESPDDALDTAWYECVACRGVIEDRHKLAMLQGGEWLPDKKTTKRIRSVAYHLNSIYSPFVTFGRVAQEFLQSKDDPSELMNFINSWLAEAWEDKAASIDSGCVLERQAPEPETVVPEWAQLLTGGVDVQKGYFVWGVDAWGAKLTNQNIAHGIAESWEDIEKIMNSHWPDTNGEVRWQVNLCAIDSGFDTEGVYDFCLDHQDWAVPVKGSSNPMTSRYRRSLIDSPNSKAHGQALYIVDTDQYKNLIAARLNKPIGPGCFMVFNGCDQEYANQLTSEHKIRERKGNREIETWVQKTSATQNHFLDCKVYAALAADLLHVRYLDERQEVVPPAPAPAIPKEQDWIPDKGEDWIK